MDTGEGCSDTYTLTLTCPDDKPPCGHPDAPPCDGHPPQPPHNPCGKPGAPPCEDHPPQNPATGEPSREAGSLKAGALVSWPAPLPCIGLGIGASKCSPAGWRRNLQRYCSSRVCADKRHTSTRAHPTIHMHACCGCSVWRPAGSLAETQAPACRAAPAPRRRHVPHEHPRICRDLELRLQDGTADQHLGCPVWCGITLGGTQYPQLCATTAPARSCTGCNGDASIACQAPLHSRWPCRCPAADDCCNRCTSNADCNMFAWCDPTAAKAGRQVSGCLLLGRSS